MYDNDNNIISFMKEHPATFKNNTYSYDIINSEDDFRIIVLIFPYAIRIFVNTKEEFNCLLFLNFDRFKNFEATIRVNNELYQKTVKIMSRVLTHVQRFKNCRQILSDIPVTIHGYKKAGGIATLIAYFLRGTEKLEINLKLFGSSPIGDEKFLTLCSAMFNKINHYICIDDTKSILAMKQKTVFGGTIIDEKGRMYRDEITYKDVMKAMFKKNEGTMIDVYRNALYGFDI